MTKSKEEWMAALEQLLEEIPAGLDMTGMKELTEKLKGTSGKQLCVSCTRAVQQYHIEHGLNRGMARVVDERA
ncbi:MAG: hypothetical protein H6729_01005 [Deltaproteobacteria bacterium]|nr:hypothetical protein [Deltaproteobacteria bacterium]